jgi:hypothetical protein
MHVSRCVHHHNSRCAHCIEITVTIQINRGSGDPEEVTTYRSKRRRKEAASQMTPVSA